MRHGAYAVEAATNALDRHRALVAGTWPLLGEEAVLGNATAAVWHGLPVWDSLLSVVHVVRPVGGHGRVGPNLHAHFAPLSAAEKVQMDGLRLTSLERTAVDLARALSYDRAVAVLDSALHLGALPGELARAVLASRRQHGVGTAREALAFADGRSESVGESISRVRIAQLGLPAPELQFAIHDHNGIWLARSDFAWPGCGVIGEFDGRVKYRGAPDEVAAVVMAEKAREQAIRDAGWSVVRWNWHDLADPSALGRRLRGALVVGA